ncbi:MAG TPA: G1 family glutamic endopeptidase [Candidatus Binatia bacterium]|nr:G1 family glutamic endopeptidase [Candidatus Binatia bacterium]
MSKATTPATSEWVFDEEGFLKKIPFRVVPTNLKGAYSVVPPRDDFDPNTASADELIKNGILWRRPTASDPPALQQAWKKFFSRKWLAKDREVPVFPPGIKRKHISRRPPRKITDTAYVSANWAGAATSNGGPYTGVVAMWTVPSVFTPPWPQSGGGDPNAYMSSSWIGLDGYDVTVKSDDVLQAGVEQDVDGGGHAHYYAWYEWFEDVDAEAQNPNPKYVDQISIPTVPVNAGDEIFVSVQYIGKTFGYIWVANRSTGRHFTIVLAPPPGADFNGKTVEWIMEDPNDGEDYTSLAKFYAVTFTDAIACTAAGSTTNPENCDTMIIETSGERVLTSTSLGNYTATIVCVSDGLLSYVDSTTTYNVSDPLIVGFEGWLEFKSLFGGKTKGGQGRIYAIDQQGRLLSYGDNGGVGNVSGPATLANSGWGNFKFVFGGINQGGEGRIYAVTQQGALHSYVDNGTSLSGPSTLENVGWGNFKFVFASTDNFGQGRIYSVDQQGQLKSYIDTGIPLYQGIMGDSDWQEFKILFGGTNQSGQGRIYAVNKQAQLLSYGDNGSAGNVSNPVIVGKDGWLEFKFLFGSTNLPGQGRIYAVFRSGQGIN